MTAIIIGPVLASADQANGTLISPNDYLSSAFDHLKKDFFCSIWRSAKGKWSISNEENEYCFLNRGTIVLTSDKTGESVRLTAGQSFTIPAGFQGTWETIEDCEKYYALYSESLLSA